MYSIETVKVDEIKEVTELVKQVFDAYVGIEYSEEGKRSFYYFVDAMKNRETVIYVAKVDQKIVGMIEMKKNHICLWFVHSNYLHQGIGKALFNRATSNLLCELSVNASNYAIKAYESLGFKRTGNLQEKDGIVFLPMIKDSPVIIEPECENDYKFIAKVLQASFKSDEEMNLVNQLRETEEYIPELSLVAKYNNRIIGHCMLTKVTINHHHGYLALAPVAVDPDFQAKSIGSQLIKESISRAKEYKGIVLLGHQDYYPRFGFVKAANYGIKCPFEVPDENYMYLELNGFESGTVKYSEAFGV